jgi:hypothetical protein
LQFFEKEIGKILGKKKFIVYSNNFANFFVKFRQTFYMTKQKKKKKKHFTLPMLNAFLEALI